MKNFQKFAILMGIFLLGTALRFYRLGSVPNGMYQDETAIGYNAYSILQTGKDEYGKPYPLYFKSFGDYKLPVYVYSTAASISMFGMTPFAVRFPSALFGSLTIIMLYFLVRRLTKDDVLSMTGAAILAVNPWHLHYSRATFEVVPGLFFFLLGTWCIALSSERRRGFFLAGTLSFLIAFYTYNLTRLLSPLLYIIVLVYFHRKHTLPERRELITTLAAGVIMLFPFFRTFLSKEGVASSAGTLIFTSAAVQAPLIELRSYLVDYPVIGKLFFSAPLLTFWQYVANIYSYFSADFFFIRGSSHGNHGIGNTGQFYIFELPLMITGITVFMRERRKPLSLLAGWLSAVIMVAALTREAPHATRSFFLLFPAVILVAKGVQFLMERLKSVQGSLKTVFTVIISLMVIANIGYFMASYFIRFPIAYAKSWRTADADLSAYLRENEKYYERIVFDDSAGFIYTSLLFYNAFPPSEFQETVKRMPDDSEGFSKVLSFGKYEIKNVSDADFRRPRTLIITTPDRKPGFARPLETFYYPKKPVVFAVKQEIMRFPIQDIAYVAVAATSQ